MKIPYLKEDGEFRPQIRQALSPLRSSDVVRVLLTPAGGYKGSIEVEVGSRGEDQFEANIDLSDWTRFPARIRSAATELRDQGISGRFRISHDDGNLLIERIRMASSPLAQFYWVNLGDSRKEVAEYKFLWAPSSTRRKDGRVLVNAGWKHVREVRKGDVVFCHEDGQIIYVACATSDAYVAPRPATRVFGRWQVEGFKIDVDLEVLQTPVDTKSFRGDFINLYNERCSPRLFSKSGSAAEQYMIALPQAAGAAILEVLGEVAERIQDRMVEAKRLEPSRSPTEREAIGKARIGQGKFRDDVLRIWGNQCPVTKVDMPELLIASHIVSWQLSTDEEKLDGYNGLALAPSVDKLFDKGYVSFSDDGRLIRHICLSVETLERLGVSPSVAIAGLSDRHREYLKRHRETHGFSS